jgi:arylsulfatase A-like enzyme
VRKPFFLWYNSTAISPRTKTRIGRQWYAAVIADLDDLGIADNTIVMYSTDNGPENDTWPDGANTPFRSQKDTNWEGAWRVPCFLRWPGKIKAGTRSS